ncbi:zinc ribbon domain-containing protein [Streptomyces sp. NBC_01186]|uniref:zinc ribbon domain-containing protein n=1 Tax=Streptomyces sp. NBC_01186 TaxID=2903765 RepID=UPI002E0E8076|nr:zinc ribbon domain-containing protein [Streptomyces sp. NBC_01186]
MPTAHFQAAQAQQERRRNIAGVERMVAPTKRSYALRGLLRCGHCDRKMQGNYNNGLPNYRCRYPAEYARSASLPHPLTVYVREGALLPALDAWIARTFAPGRLKQTLQALHQAQSVTTPAPGPALEVARRTLADCDRRIDRYRAAIDAGTNPALVTEWINKATADRNAAQRQIAAAATATPERKAPLYAAFGLSLTYGHSKRAVTVESRPESACTACAYGACPREDVDRYPTNRAIGGRTALAIGRTAGSWTDVIPTASNVETERQT